MSSVITRTGIAATLAVLVLFTASCAADGPSGDAPPTDSNVVESSAKDSGNPDPAEPAASFTEEELDGALVSSFPSDVPLYPGEVVNSVAALSEVSEQPEWNALIATSDSFEAVDAAIRSDYTSGGWEIRSEMDYMGGYLLVTGKAGYTVSIMYHDLEGTGITINYGVSS